MAKAKNNAKEGGKPSATALALHKKWQDAAKKMGGEAARIVIKKPEAKTIIFNLLRDAFKPMNINEIYKALKAAVPSPVLKSCLEDMALDPTATAGPDASDDDDDFVTRRSSPTSSTAQDCMSGLLKIKMGRNVNTTLYYVNQDKLENNGNGMLPENRNELMAIHQTSKVEHDALLSTLKHTGAETARLISEPKNAELAELLQTEEQCMSDLNEKIRDAHELKINEKHVKQTKKRVQTMSTHWRKRRKLCMDFLRLMEDCTEGTISVKKCLAGSGQIEVESDDAAIEGEKEAYKNKRAVGAKKRPNAKEVKSSNGGVVPTESFIGVKLDAHFNVSRVFVEG